MNFAPHFPRVSLTLSLCAVLLHPMRAAASMTISSLTGAVTTTEINSFVTYMASQTPPTTPWGGTSSTAHNAWADGDGGRDLEALGMMWEVSKNRTIINQMVSWTDDCASQRNDLMSAANGGHRIMWTGRIEPVWCPNAPNSTSPGYAGGENGDTEAHIAYTALEILQSPALWNVTVPDHNPYGYGVTYLQRAKTYIRYCDEGNIAYNLRQFVVPSTNLIRDPADWPSNYHTMEAINIMMMLDGDFERMAQCHEILGDNPGYVARYNAVVKASVDECLAGMMHSYIRKGQTVYKWYYYPYNTSNIENVGHAAYDMLGIYRAGAATGNPYGIDRSSVLPLSNTLVDVIYLGNNQFAGNVDGTGTPQNNMLGEWMGLADWNAQVYTLVGGADLASGYNQNDANVDAYILWMKNRRYLGIAPTH